MRIFLFIVFWLASTTAFSQSEFQIDDEGNIILIDKAKPKVPEPERPEDEIIVEDEAAPARKSKSIKINAPDPSPTPAPQKNPVVTEKPETPAQNQATSRPTSTPEFEKYKKPETASVASRTAKVLRSPEPSADLALLLKRGDPLKILGVSTHYAHIEYELDGFPIKGWVERDQIVVLKTGQAPLPPLVEQTYTPESREEPVQTQVKEVPLAVLPEKPEFETEQTSPEDNFVSSADRDPRERKKIKSFMPEPWFLEGSLGIGYAIYNEKVSSDLVDPNDPNASIPGGVFLDYELTGVNFDLSAKAGYDYKRYRVGGLLSYNISIFSTDYSETTLQLQGANVLAQLQDIAIGPFISARYPIKNHYVAEPELRMTGHLQLYTTNQLEDPTGATPIFFSHTALYMKTSLIPRFHFPYDLTLEPELGLVLLYNFAESPTAGSGAASVATGEAKSASMLTQYGGALLWNLEKSDLPNTSLKLAGRIDDYSKKFGQQGNRAGRATLNASTKTTFSRVFVGVEHKF